MRSGDALHRRLGSWSAVGYRLLFSERLPNRRRPPRLSVGYPSIDHKWVSGMSRRLDIFGHEWVPDVVVSGMNRGLNAGRALLISGTVAAAREGTFHGAKALAVSMHSFSSRMQDPNDYTSATHNLLPILHWFISEEKWPSGVILNVNIPHENTTSKIARWMHLLGVVSTAGAVSTCLKVVPQGQSSLQFRSTPSEACVAARKTEGETRMYKFRWQVAIDPQATPENDDLVAILNKCASTYPICLLTLFPLVV